MIEKFGDHLLHCRNIFQFSGTPRMRRQNSTVILLSADLKQVGFNALVEPRGVVKFQSRRDVKEVGKPEAKYINVTGNVLLVFFGDVRCSAMSGCLGRSCLSADLLSHLRCSDRQLYFNNAVIEHMTVIDMHCNEITVIQIE